METSTGAQNDPEKATPEEDFNPEDLPDEGRFRRCKMKTMTGLEPFVGFHMCALASSSRCLCILLPNDENMCP